MFTAEIRIFHSDEFPALGKIIHKIADKTGYAPNTVRELCNAEEGFYYTIGKEMAPVGPFKNAPAAMKDIFQPPKKGTEIRWECSQ